MNAIAFSTIQCLAQSDHSASVCSIVSITFIIATCTGLKSAPESTRERYFAGFGILRSLRCSPGDPEALLRGGIGIGLFWKETVPQSRSVALG